jgi:hypothetical protein
VRGGFGFERPEGGVSFGYAYGWESDYKSNVVSATTHHDLYEHNFTLALAYSHNWDDVCDNNNRAAIGLPLERTPLTSSAQCFTGADTVVTHRVHIDTLEPSLSWTMTPRLVVQGGATIQLLDGFQSNPYRKVLVGSQIEYRWRMDLPSWSSEPTCRSSAHRPAGMIISHTPASLAATALLVAAHSRNRNSSGGVSSGSS